MNCIGCQQHSTITTICMLYFHNDLDYFVFCCCCTMYTVAWCKKTFTIKLHMHIVNKSSFRWQRLKYIEKCVEFVMFSSMMSHHHSIAFSLQLGVHVEKLCCLSEMNVSLLLHIHVHIYTCQILSVRRHCTQ